MVTRHTIGLGLLALAIAAASSTARAESVLLSTDYRYAALADKTSVRGDATVAKSQQLPRGLRLAAAKPQEGKAAAEEAVATAVYLFNVPLAAKSVTIEVAYRPDPAAKDKEIAGLLFVRNQAMEEKARAIAKERNVPIEDPTYFGNLYFLKGGEVTSSVTLPTADIVVKGVLEVHLSAAAGQAFDAQYVQVSAQQAVVSYAGAYRPQIQGGYANDPLLRYPQPSYGGQITSFDPIFWHQFSLLRFPYSYYYYGP